MIEDKKRTFKDLSAEEVLDAIDNSYYVDKIRKIDDEIHDIQWNKFGHYIGKEKDKRIAELRERKDRYEKIARELSRVESSLHTSMNNIEQIAKEAALQDSFRKSLYRFVRGENDSKDSSYQVLQSKIGRKLEKNGISLRKNARKINKNTYKLLKKNGKKFTLDLTELKVKGSFHTIRSTEKFIEETKYQINTILLSYYNEQKEKNSLSYNPRANNIEMHFMGVDVDLLKKADNGLNITLEGIEASKKLKDISYFKKNYQSLNIKYSDIEELEKMYQDIHTLSKEVAGMEVVLDAFKNAIIADSDVYRITIQIKEEQKNKLKEMFNKAESLYNSLGLVEKRHQKIGIDKLVQELKRIDEMIESYGPITERNYDKLNELK